MIEKAIAPSIVSLQIGMPAMIAHGSKEVLSGIFKQPVSDERFAGAEGIEGDGQGDTINHGGPDKAICAYFAERYPYWESQFGRPFFAGSFGENMTIGGWTEEDLCIGDIIEGNEIRLQVSQPRQPCFKLGLRNELPILPSLVQQTGYSGFYFRVLRPGRIASGERLNIVQRHPAGMTIMEANRIMYHQKENVAAIEKLLAVKELAASWHEQLGGRLSKLRGDS
ncbi:MOSC domain-containing protein [Paenibacillus sp. LHD-117]|uniref:MOSC domain-containing protein n=1 Tax=Paenibacillus sp. LHD-117 TaxID=3071412 RepID=UPI0027E0BEEA|nr:MOSC domain-containing protein [Paenibacillus sp. LHD-117]MDQ6418055.1 MOSC domain-containing protein [Paenibacillus sp. LHD-117]